MIESEGNRKKYIFVVFMHESETLKKKTKQSKFCPCVQDKQALKGWNE